MKPAWHRYGDTKLLLAVLVLFLNDQVLKYAWPGPITGKLSDFAGVFAFTWCLMALFPERLRTVSVAVAVFFIWWKSPWSSGAIDAWNNHGGWTIGRVVDPWDLLALLMLPTARRLWQGQATIPTRWRVILGAVAAWGTFTATSRARVMMPRDLEVLYYDEVYALDVEPAAFWGRMASCLNGQSVDTTAARPGREPQHAWLGRVALREISADSVAFTVWARGRKVRFGLMRIVPDHPIRVFSLEEVRIHKDYHRRLLEQTVLRCLDPRSVPHDRWDPPVHDRSPE